MNKEIIYSVIDGERVYQDEMTARSDRPDMIEDFHVGDTLSAIQYNLDRARECWYKDAIPHERSMDYLRKIAALCVKAGERYGMPPRQR